VLEFRTQRYRGDPIRLRFAAPLEEKSGANTRAARARLLLLLESCNKHAHEQRIIIDVPPRHPR